MRGARIDVSPTSFTSLAASYSARETVVTDTQEILGINAFLSMRVFWSMSGDVLVRVTVNGALRATTGGAAYKSSYLDVTLAAGDEFSITMLRNGPRTGYIQLINMSAGYVQLALISVTIT
jgi:hypothetical protein